MLGEKLGSPFCFKVIIHISLQGSPVLRMGPTGVAEPVGHSAGGPTLLCTVSDVAREHVTRGEASRLHVSCLCTAQGDSDLPL